MPESKQTIGGGVFTNSKNLASIILLESVTAIENDAFDGREGLTTISVSPDFYAEQYCKDNDMPSPYTDPMA